MNWEAKQWQKRVQIYEQTGKAGLMCLRCGISRPRMCKWWGRYQAEGIKGLMSRNRPPKEIPFRKATPEIEQWVLHIRQNQTIGSRRIQRELQRLHDVRLSAATIHKVLERNQVTPFRRPSRRRRASQYEKKALGAQLQIARSSSKPSKRCRFPSSAARRTKALSSRPMTSKGPGERHVKRRSNKPRMPHLNGKSERVQLMDLQKLCATGNLTLPARHT